MSNEFAFLLVVTAAIIGWTIGYHQGHKVMTKEVEYLARKLSDTTKELLGAKRDNLPRQQVKSLSQRAHDLHNKNDCA